MYSVSVGKHDVPRQTTHCWGTNLDQASENSSPTIVIDPFTEAAFDELDGNEQKEFGEIKDKLNKVRKHRKVHVAPNCIHTPTSTLNAAFSGDGM